MAEGVWLRRVGRGIRFKEAVMRKAKGVAKRAEGEGERERSVDKVRVGMR